MTNRPYSIFGDSSTDRDRNPVQGVITPPVEHEVEHPHDSGAISGEIGKKAVRIVHTWGPGGAEERKTEIFGYDPSEVQELSGHVSTLLSSDNFRAIELKPAPAHQATHEVIDTDELLLRKRDSRTIGPGIDSQSDMTQAIPRPVNHGRSRVSDYEGYAEDDQGEGEWSGHYQTDRYQSGTDELDEMMEAPEKVRLKEIKRKRRLPVILGVLAASGIISYGSAAGIHTLEHSDYTFIESVLDPGATLEPITDSETRDKMKSQVSAIIKLGSIG